MSILTFCSSGSFLKVIISEKDTVCWKMWYKFCYRLKANCSLFPSGRSVHKTAWQTYAVYSGECLLGPSAQPLAAATDSNRDVLNVFTIELASLFQSICVPGDLGPPTGNAATWHLVRMVWAVRAGFTKVRFKWVSQSLVTVPQIAGKGLTILCVQCPVV